MSIDTLVPCIIAGGAGRRLWPVSREAMPKPFIRLADGQSLLQKTFSRLLPLCGLDAPLVVANHALRYRVLDDYQALDPRCGALNLVLEPFGRNTAAAVLACALWARDHRGDAATILVCPADQLIDDVPAFHEAVAWADELAAAGYLTTFGIQPTRAETGYGYIACGPRVAAHGYGVDRFVEKPCSADAQAFVDSGQFLWNAGMFCATAGVLLDEAERCAPQLLERMRACWRASRRQRMGWWALDETTFAAVPEIAFDKAVMERSHRLAVVPCALQWRDVGSWQAMSELTAADPAGNRILGRARLRDAHDCYVDSLHRLTVLIGVAHLAVIDTPDALLIMDKARSQEVKCVADALDRERHPAYVGHRTVHRPWGRYTVLSEAENYKVKRIVVKPGASLSLQSHRRRSEHWVVVSGTAQVSNGVDSFLLHTNESTFIRMGDKHRLSNPAACDLVIVEVQNGPYLGEDDITRYDDDYGRL